MPAGSAVRRPFSHSRGRDNEITRREAVGERARGIVREHDHGTVHRKEIAGPRVRQIEYFEKGRPGKPYRGKRPSSFRIARSFPVVRTRIRQEQV